MQPAIFILHHLKKKTQILISVVYFIVFIIITKQKRYYRTKIAFSINSNELFYLLWTCADLVFMFLYFYHVTQITVKFIMHYRFMSIQNNFTISFQNMQFHFILQFQVYIVANLHENRYFNLNKQCGWKTVKEVRFYNAIFGKYVNKKTKLWIFQIDKSTSAPHLVISIFLTWQHWNYGIFLYHL